MKKTYKILAIIGSISLAIGILLTILGLSFGGYHTVTIGRNGLNIITGEKIEGKESFEEMKQIYLDVEVANIEFIASDHYGLEYVYEKERESFSYEMKDGILTITGKHKMTFLLFQLGIFNKKQDNIIKIYYPKDAQMDNITVSTNVGNIHLNDIQVHELNVDSHLGNMQLDHVVIEKGKINLNLGSLSANNSQIKNTEIRLNLGSLEWKHVETTNLIVDNNLGSVEIEGTLNGITSITCSMGDVELETTLSEQDYQIRLKTDLGTNKINHKKVSNDLEKGSGESKIIVNNNAGDIELQFQES